MLLGADDAASYRPGQGPAGRPGGCGAGPPGSWPSGPYPPPVEACSPAGDCGKQRDRGRVDYM